MKFINVFASPTRIAAVQDNGKVLYFDQGTKEALFIGKIVAPAIHSDGYWEGEINTETVVKKTEATYVEESKVVRFFRVARKALTDFFSSEEKEEEPEVEIKQISEKALDALVPVEGNGVPATEVAPDPTPKEKPKRDLSKLEAVAKLMTTTNEVKESMQRVKETKDETVVAVVGDTVIPDVQSMSKYIASAKHSKEALDNFFKRLAGVIEKRRYSAEDLLKFLEKANLPLANDGTIVVFKALNRKEDTAIFQDIHSGTVDQTEGTLVYMDESKVDPNRNQDCSHGLHIASISYLSGFTGSDCMVCVIRPEDVIAVPKYNTNKMRVCAYHNVFLLSSAGYSALKNNNLQGLPDADKLLVKHCIEGDYPQPSSRNYLGNLGLVFDNPEDDPRIEKPESETTEETVQPEPEVVPDEITVQGEPEPTPVETAPVELDEVTDEVEPEAPIPQVDTKKLAATAKGGKQTLAQRVADMLEGYTPDTLPKAVALEINKFKKQKKKGYGALGVPVEFHEVLKNAK